MESRAAGDAGRAGAGLRVVAAWAEEHPSHYVVRDLVAELTDQGATRQAAKVGRTTGRVLAKSGLSLPSRLRRRGGPVIVPLMGARFGELYAAALCGDVVPYCWDVWEPHWETWVRRLRPLRPPAVFVTAAQSARFLSERLPHSRVIHAPEATRMSGYSPGRPLAARTIGVLELGRRYQVWHEAVREAVSRAERPHLYSRWSSQLVFPDEVALRSGLSDTIVSVCFPSSLTHPRRAGRVETMTHRYLESIASGCLVIGHAPPELVELMGFNPVIEADWSAPADQVLGILAEPDRWQDTADTALRRLREVGDWSVRVRGVLAALDAAGVSRRRG